MSDHPPIPPNSSIAGFYEYDGSSCDSSGVLFKVSESELRTVRWNDLGLPWRQIVASLARAGWLDEAKRQCRLANSLFSENSIKDKYGSMELLLASYPVWPDYTAAGIASSDSEKHAEKWRIWGEQK